jgi:hypothetical protein
MINGYMIMNNDTINMVGATVRRFLHSAHFVRFGRNDEAIGGEKVLGGGEAAAQHPLSSKKRRHPERSEAKSRDLPTIAPAKYFIHHTSYIKKIPI